MATVAKGAIRVPLITKGQLIRVWYEFYRLALKSNDTKIQQALKKSARYYKDWGCDANLLFDAWWKRHANLFEQRSFVHLHDGTATRNSDFVYLAVPKWKKSSVLIAEIRMVLKLELPKAPVSSFVGGKYCPTEEKGMKMESLRAMLDLHRDVFSKSDLKGKALTDRVIGYFSAERYKRRKNYVPPSFVIDSGTSKGDHKADAERNIRRYRQKAKKILLNVAGGQFPGTYG